MIESIAAMEPEDRGPFELSAFLATRLQGPGLKRTARTRTRLEVAAAELLQEVGYHELKIAEICARADCGHGTFYRYWPDREAVARDVIADFMEAIRVRRPRLPHATPLFERLVRGHLYYVEVFRLNAGLMRCLVQLNIQLPGFAEIGGRANIHLAQRVVAAFEREGLPAVDGDAARLRRAVALSCVTVVDGMLRNRYIHGQDVGLNDDEMAVQLSLIWYRTFLARDPAPGEVARIRDLVQAEALRALCV